jgi:hypothetical protein
MRWGIVVSYGAPAYILKKARTIAEITIQYMRKCMLERFVTCPTVEAWPAAWGRGPVDA